MKRLFYLQILDAQTGEVAVFRERRLEREFVEACVTAIAAKGVGVFRTEAAVKQAIRDGMEEAIHDLKHDTKALI